MTIWVYIHSFSRCCLPNLRNSEIIRTYSSSKSSKVIDLGISRKRMYATSYYSLNVSHRFEILTHTARKFPVFPQHTCSTPRTQGESVKISGGNLARKTGWGYSTAKIA